MSQCRNPCTVTPGCQWRCSWHHDQWKPWCCHRCLRTRGADHSHYCESRQQHNRRDAPLQVPRRTSRSPRRQDIHQSLRPVVHSLHVIQRTIISCGHLGLAGKLLLRDNFRLQDPKRCYDVTNALHDPFHLRNSPDGTHPETQRRLSLLEGFTDVHRRILTFLLNERYTVVVCNHGRHRSVGAVEMAVKDFERLQYCRFEVEIIHIDLRHDIDECLWRRLCAVGCD